MLPSGIWALALVPARSSKAARRLRVGVCMSLEGRRPRAGGVDVDERLFMIPCPGMPVAPRRAPTCCSHENRRPPHALPTGLPARARKTRMSCTTRPASSMACRRKRLSSTSCAVGSALRSAPSVDAALMATLPAGQPVFIEEKRGRQFLRLDGVLSHWYRVTAGKHTGWTWGGNLLKPAFGSAADASVKFVAYSGALPVGGRGADEHDLRLVALRNGQETIGSPCAPSPTT
ncbi:MAG: SH3 domain-containing protein [Flavobacteriales bacterium]